jgi:cell division septation protein DedD
METSTKERLTGALLVVLAVVIVAPELLSGRRAANSGPPPAQDPEAGAPLQTFDGAIDAAAEMPSATRNVPAEAAAAIAAVPPPVAAETPPMPEPAGAPSSPAIAADGATTTAPPAQDRKSAVGQSKDSAKQLARTTVAAPAAASAAKWWVQLGSFASSDNAQRLARRLRAAGFSIDVSHSSSKGKELYRVRAGPVADKAAANALRARLAAAGEKNVSVVAP